MIASAPALSGPWSREAVADFLERTRIPVRVACHGSTGHPLIASLWFVPRDGLLWCATQRSSTLARRLAEDGRCAFEVALDTPPYRGVRGQGHATLHEERGLDVLQAAISRYGVDPDSSFAGWLLGRADRETAIAVRPHRMASWDYRHRMADAAG